ncbi:Glutathione S-transferase [Labilithrix luteola]|uniref:Glutathione S-transferase n=1 Tax=Labilithrix luteola TaxID=1391654 RepID=A0A0K1PLY9_9BACT|nr:glutathione binding-like protein [Labilithrix luteola]AKU94553.1 Glutathione S-transferase [Labilithrix luteola]
MELYFSPLACSLATRIAFYEAGASATYVEVDTKTKTTLDGRDFRKLNPLGLVPTLRTDDGAVLTENAAILQYVADRVSSDLAPKEGFARAQLQQWLCFIGTELHKAIFGIVFDKSTSAEIKAYAFEKGKSRWEMLNTHLTGREFLLDQFSVADAYLVTVLNWCQVTPIKLADYPALDAYLNRLRARPSVAKALAEELPLYLKEQARAKVA